jgi:hypothetical protein
MKKLAFVLLLAAACSTKSPGFIEDDAGPDVKDSGSIVTFEGGSMVPPTEVYGQTAAGLFRLNPVTKEVVKVGNFEGCIYVNDIAIDQSSTIYGVTANQLVRIDRNAAKCTLITMGAFPNSLSFVPAGTLDKTSEALVGYEGADYVRIDTQTGKKTKVGQLSGGLTSSGDIVSVIGGDTFLTVKGQGCQDCLAQIDPKTGDLVMNYGPIGFTDVFGLAFWGGRLYGFTNDGTLFEVQINNGVLSTMEITIPNKTPDLLWAGAGSTTSAPLMPPN